MGMIGTSGGRERRRHIRVRLDISARLEAPPRAAMPCEVYNMSAGGALLETREGLRLGQTVILHVEAFGAIPAHVARVTSTVVALAFDGVDQGALDRFIAARVRRDDDGDPLANAAGA